jgi:transposase InsO family protein
VKYAFVEAESAQWPIAVLCETLEVSRSGYYAWVGRPEAPKVAEDVAIVAEIKAAYKAGRGAYGSPRVVRALRKKGRSVSENRVARLMRQEGIVGRKKKRFKKTTDSNHPDPIAPNVLERNFTVELPDTAWVTDVTYVFTHQGWLYLAVILDLFSRRVVGWAASANNDRALALDALAKAVERRNPAAGIIHHSDRGSVYASGDYSDALDALRATKSMSRKGDCWDNSVAESFFATIKGEMIDHEDYETRAQAIAAIDDYIEGFYNVTRLHSAIGYMSPIEFELKFRIDNQAA